MSTTLTEFPKNLICNFRAPNPTLFNRWKSYVGWAKDHGYDVCHITLSLVDSFMLGVEGSAQIKLPQQTINIQMQNSFLYQVEKSRRTPFSLDCIKPEFQRTFSSALFDAYVLNKARDLNREFSFRDYLEIKHDSFRRIMVRLRQKGKVIANPQRTNPRFYFLPEKLLEYNAQCSKTDVYGCEVGRQQP